VAPATRPRRGRSGGGRARLLRSPKVAAGSLILLFFVLLAAFGPMAAPH
jgi:peptide/nickel transport system permease protein